VKSAEIEFDLTEMNIFANDFAILAFFAVQKPRQSIDAVKINGNP
jgi:hypothetical protein